mmetsp:Transcript_62693/g.152612  ORF Transcript_62693/g.152612 Transcript_62693/m.152612 type:complete len:143 (+) Transcript_62693:197-625(+)
MKENTPGEVADIAAYSSFACAVSEDGKLHFSYPSDPSGEVVLYDQWHTIDDENTPECEQVFAGDAQVFGTCGDQLVTVTVTGPGEEDFEQPLTTNLSRIMKARVTAVPFISYSPEYTLLLCEMAPEEEDEDEDEGPSVHDLD